MSNDYYLVAKYKGESLPTIISLNTNWYLENRVDNFSRGNDISAIDIVTTKFKDLEQMKDRMYDRKYIKSKDVDIFITHKHKYNGKNYINEYELIFDNEKEERMNILRKISKKRLNGYDIEQEDTNELMNKFVSKCQSKQSFFTFMTNPYSKIDKHIIEKLIKVKKANYSIKYNFEKKLSQYSVIRNIISMWNMYDELVKKYENLGEEKLGKQIISDYIDILNSRNGRRTYYNEIKEKTDSNYIEGQMHINDFKEKKEQTYEEGMKELFDKARELKERPFDDPYVQKLFDEGGLDRAIQIPDKLRNSLTLEDRYKLGLVGDVVDYFRLKEKKDGQIHN